MPPDLVNDDDSFGVGGGLRPIGSVENRRMREWEGDRNCRENMTSGVDFENSSENKTWLSSVFSVLCSSTGR